MDFMKLLSVAQKNNEVSKQSASYSYYPSKIQPAKKETKQSKILSENVKKFLAKKEEEERQKALEEKKKRENLLAMRDSKAQSRINKHLKVCKSANKSVLVDAVNQADTAVTIAGPSQPDEDDYGYVSQEASAFYNKLMSKYSNSPSEKPLFSDNAKKVVKDIASTKERVKQALKQPDLDEPHRRKRKSNELSDREEPQEKKSCSEKDRDNKDDKEEKSKLKKKAMPPPMDFMSLLKLAEQKQHEPAPLELKPKTKEENERLMTKKQLREYQLEKERRERREREKNGEIAKPSASTESIKSSTTPNRIPKISGTSSSSTTNGINNSTKPSNSILEKALQKSLPAPSKRAPEKTQEKSSTSKPSSSSSSSSASASASSSSSSSSTRDEILEEKRKIEAERRELEAMRRKLEEERRQLALTKGKVEEIKSKSMKPNGKSDKPTSSTSKSQPAPANGKAKSSSDIKPRQFPPADVKPRQFPPADLKPKQFPPADLKPRQFPPADVRGSRPSGKPIKRNGLTINKRRIYDDDDEDEYDSELDDFIADDDEGAEDYSKYISEIFGYDKRKYAYLDDDDDNMESSYAQQLKEEFVSSKIGLMEDLEDIRQEALEKKRKAAMAKKKRK